MDVDTARASSSENTSDRTLDTASIRAGRPRGGGGRRTAPAAEPGHASRWSVRLKNSAWAPVLAKAATVFAGMLALAAVGAASTLRGPGVSLEEAPHGDTTRANLGGIWLAPAPSNAPTPTASASARKDEGTAPRRDEPGAPNGKVGEQGGAKFPSAPAGKNSTNDGKVILNFATAEDLVRLPGVGKKRAEAILALRQRLGRFKRPTDLLRVRGIGPRSLQRMLPHLVVDAPKRTE